jgi:pimeloyl-ACP methyl ester carboxylesterase
MTQERFKQMFKTLAALWVALFIGGCSTPVGVTSLGMNSGYDQIDRSALNSSDYSSYTASILHRYDLERFYAKKPTPCLIQLHELACADDRDDVLFALSELAFLQGKDGRRDTVDGHELVAKNYFAASAIYAYLFLGRLEKADPKAAFDRRFRLACDLYNRSLGYIIAQRKGPVAEMPPVIWLPVGSIRLQPGVTDLPKPLSEYVEVSSADHYKVNGLSVRNRMAGMGTPLVLVSARKSESGVISVGFAATVFMRIRGDLADFKTGSLLSEVDVYSSTSTHTVEINDRVIPLEQDITTPIAYTLSNPLYWQIEKALFRFGKSDFEPGIYQPQPSKPGKIPVLWVHGTMSSPVWWAEMWNTLMGDPVLRENYQHWFYLYDSAKPIVLSFAHLRKSIDEFVKKRDPEGKDPALQQMVVIGHSQGGLLTKATAVNTGEELIRAVTGKTLAELKLSPADEKLAREYTMFTPLPQVKRVVFISTPHRGSFLASNLARRVVKWFITLPQQTVKTTAEVMQIIPKKSQVTIAATSLDSMSPENPGLLALAEIPVSPSIKAHSIIAIDGDEVPPEGDDGVVKYSSAHVTGVESELVVRSYHSCQDKPKTIEEVRRILLEHLKAIKQQK